MPSQSPSSDRYPPANSPSFYTGHDVIWEGSIDKAIGKGAPALSLWRRLLSGMKERYPFKEDVIYCPGKWTTEEKSIQYLRKLAVLEVIYGDLDDDELLKDPDEAQCT
ncbi:hypothetical protein QYF61_005218 [Mycteria americana]|uniref:Uncharacterized protein n=1 Tax=Mycteria americana TaxID=33587 RepID=A0AAN7S100_MYCAM|nr:hypothetical protein QYF61_005218 [Mycteria americana]